MLQSFCLQIILKASSTHPQRLLLLPTVFPAGTVSEQKDYKNQTKSACCPSLSKRSEKMSRTKDYEEFSRRSSTEKLPDDIIFQKISEFDIKYQNSDDHDVYFQGLLCNIGTEQRSTKILTCVISRLKKRKKKMPIDKYYYDLANTINSMADIESPSIEEPSFIKYLIESKDYREARKYFDKVARDDQEHFKRAVVNNANILEKYGRNNEIVSLYDKALRLTPNFGAALANKAISLEHYRKIYQYYFNICHHKRPALLYQVHSLLKKSLQDETMKDVLGREGVCRIEGEFKRIDALLKETNSFPKKKTHQKCVSNYRKFILDNNLFLNFDFGFYYDKYSLHDNFFPNLIEPLGKESNLDSAISKKNKSSLYVFNQIIESYTSSRYIFFQALNTNRENDGYIDYIYTYDFIKNSTKLGMLKSVFCSLYNCLDKVAYFIKFYFLNIEPSLDKNIYFEDLTKEDFKEIIKKNKNIHLLALFSLALDFKDEFPYAYLRITRNKITHSYINIFDDFAISDDHRQHESSEEEIIKDIFNLFIIIKSAMMYSILSIREDNKNYKTFPLYVTMQNQIYGS